MKDLFEDITEREEENIFHNTEYDVPQQPNGIGFFDLFVLEKTKSYQSAIIYNHIRYHIDSMISNQHEPNKRHGVYWYEVTLKTLSKIFPYMKKGTVERAISKLVDNDLLVSKRNVFGKYANPTCCYTLGKIIPQSANANNGQNTINYYLKGSQETTVEPFSRKREMGHPDFPKTGKRENQKTVENQEDEHKPRFPENGKSSYILDNINNNIESKTHENSPKGRSFQDSVFDNFWKEVLKVVPSELRKSKTLSKKFFQKLMKDADFKQYPQQELQSACLEYYTDCKSKGKNPEYMKRIHNLIRDREFECYLKSEDNMTDGEKAIANKQIPEDIFKTLIDNFLFDGYWPEYLAGPDPEQENNWMTKEQFNFYVTEKEKALTQRKI